MQTQTPSTTAPAPAKPHRRWLRIPLYAFGALLVLFVAGRIYLSTPQTARLVSEKLSQALGVPLRIASVSPGLGSSSVGQVEIGDEGKPWATVKEVVGDVSLVGLAAGEMPHALTLREAAVVLHFDAAGKLLTKLPGALGRAGGESSAIPAIRLEKCRLTLAQEGHGDSVFDGIDADLKEEGGQLKLGGTLSDSLWGQWALAAELDPKAMAGNATLKTPAAVKVTPELLTRVPFVKESVWAAVSLDGPATADIRFDFTADDFRYRVQAGTRNSAVSVSCIDLKATDAAGSVTVEGGVVTLKGAHGKAADGTVDVDGTLDFRQHPNVLKLSVTGKDLLVKDLPADWDIEKSVPVKGIGDGRLSGHADLVLTTAGGKTTTAGSGDATVVVPKFVSDQDLKVDIHLAPNGGRFNFSPKTGSQGLLPPAASKHSTWSVLAASEHSTWSVFTTALLTALTAPPPEPKAEPAKGPSYLDLDFALRDVDLGELVGKLEYKVPFKIGGRITVKVKVGIPTNAAGDQKAYRLDGTADLPKLTVEDLTVENVTAKVSYRDGVLTLTDFSGRMPEPGNPKSAGTFKGTATYGVVPAGDLSAKLDLLQLPVGQLLGLFPAAARGAEGNVSGAVDFKAPSGQLSNPAQWTGTARLSSDRFKAIGLAVRQLRFEASLAGGVLNLPAFTGDIEGAQLNAGGKLTLAGQYPVQGKVQISKVDLANLDKLSPGFKLPVSLKGLFEANADVSGDLKPMNVTLAGTGSARKLAVEEFPVDKLDFRWKLTPDSLAVTDIASRLFAGTLGGTANIPLQNDAPGAVDLNLNKLDLAELSKKVSALADLKLEGVADGTIKANMPPAPAGQSRQARADIDIRSPKLKVRNIPAEKLHATADYRDATLNYKIDAAALGGTIELDGAYPPKPDAKPGPQGRLQIRDVRVRELGVALGLPASYRQLGGRIQFDLPYSFDAKGRPTGTGTLRIERLSYAGREIASRFQSRAVLKDSLLEFDKVEGNIGGGSAAGTVSINTENFDRSRLRLVLRGVPADHLLFAAPDYARSIDASFDAEITTTLGRSFRGGGTLSGTGGKFFGTRAGEFRIPLQWDYVPAQDRGSFAVQDLSGTLAQGAIAGKVSYEYFGASGGRVDGEIRFQNVSVGAINPALADLGSYGVGRSTGKFTFSGGNVRTVDDLQGTLTASLGEARITEIPILSAVVPFLGGSGLVADQRSEVRAVLSRGVWQVQRLALLGKNLQLFAEGTVTNSGRLNLAVVARTSQIPISPALLTAAGIAVPSTAVVGPIPVGLILRVSEFLADRTVNLQVTGTVRQPSAHVNTAKLLSDSIVRFFLNQNNIPSP